jgi:phosphoribosyl 1,2-cyclic phosphodiesterase
MGIYVTFWGVRGSIPTPGHATQRYGGNTACIEVRVNDEFFILDGGSGLRSLGSSLAEKGLSSIKAHMLFSHSHWDHIQGFPFFIPVYNPDTVLKVYDPDTTKQSIYALLHGQMQDRYFPVQFSDLGSTIVSESFVNGKKQIGDITLAYYDTCHPGGSLAYSITSNGKKVVYSTDNELDLMLLNREASLKNPKTFRKAPKDFIKFIKGADLFIADGQYTDEEYLTKINWGHPRATTLVDASYEAGVKNLAITHHDPMQSDSDVDLKIEACRQRAREVGYKGVIFPAREGVTLKF